MWPSLKRISVAAAGVTIAWVVPVLAKEDVLTIYDNSGSAIAQEMSPEAPGEETEENNSEETSSDISPDISEPTNVAEICAPPEDINRAESLPEGGENISSWINQGSYLLTKKQYPEALTAYYRAIALDENNSEVWIGCGTVLQEMEEYDRAIAALNQALKISPNSSVALLTRGLIYKQAERYEEALADLQNALEADRNWGEYNQANVAINLGSVLWRLDQRSEAIAAFEQATKLDDQFALAWFNLGTAFLQQATSLLAEEQADAAKTPLEQAITAYDQALASQGEWGINTGPASAWYNRGVALELLERYDEAMESYDRALRMTPNHTKARQRLARLRDR